MATWKHEFTPAGILAPALVLLGISGCAVVPTEHSSRVAEVTWQVLDAIDTAQTVQLAKHPACYHEADPIAAGLYGGSHPQSSKVVAVNLLLMPVHSAVSRWFDNRVNDARDNSSDTVGLWYTGRIVWHAASLLATGISVADNYSRGLTPTAARCDR